MSYNWVVDARVSFTKQDLTNSYITSLHFTSLQSIVFAIIDASICFCATDILHSLLLERAREKHRQTCTHCCCDDGDGNSESRMMKQDSKKESMILSIIIMSRSIIVWSVFCSILVQLHTCSITCVSGSETYCKVCELSFFSKTFLFHCLSLKSKKKGKTTYQTTCCCDNFAVAINSIRFTPIQINFIHQIWKKPYLLHYFSTSLFIHCKDCGLR